MDAQWLVRSSWQADWSIGFEQLLRMKYCTLTVYSQDMESNAAVFGSL